MVFGRLFGKKPATSEQEVAIDYKDHRIFVAPLKEGKEYRIAARIEKDVDGETKVHQLIRADTMADKTAAEDASLAKAKQVIDQQARWLFDD